MNKNADLDKYSDSEYSIKFNSRFVLISNLNFGKNVIIFGEENSSSTNAYNKKYIFYLLKAYV